MTWLYQPFPLITAAASGFKAAMVNFNHLERHMKKNVAGQKVGIQMCSATDGSAFTGSVTVSVTGDAGTQATGSVGSGACTHEGNGYHTYAPAQAETNYDLVAFTFTGSGAIPQTIQIWPSFPQTGDSFALIGSTGSGLTSLATQASVNTIDDFLDTEIAAIKTQTDKMVFTTANQLDVQVLSMAANTLTATAINADAITAAKVAADVTTELQTGLATAASIAALNNLSSTDVATAVWNAATATYGSAGSYGLLVETNIDAAITTRLASASYTAPDNASITAILADTNELQTDWVNGGRLDLILDARASQTSLDTLDDFVDTEVAAIKAKTDQLTFTTANQLDAQVLSMAAGTVTAAAIATNAIDADAIATDAVTEIQSGLATAANLAVVAGYLDTEIAAILADTNELQVDWANGGRLDLILDARASQTSVDDLPTNAELATALGTADDAVLAQVALVKAQTDLIPAAPASTTNITAGTITTVTNLTNAPTNGDLTATMKTSITTAATAATPIAASVAGNVGGNVVGSVGSVTGLTASNLDATISSRATPAQVNAEVVDALNVDAYAEPGLGAPGASISLAAKIGYMYKAWRNRTSQTATTYSLYNDDASTVDQKATTSDDGTTFERTEVESGT